MRDRGWRQGPFGAAFVLGFALSGLFDGLLLHQILQWHHLLSLMPGEAARDLRFQILADGLFHALMYGLAVAGLILLWRQRRGLTEAGAGRRVVGGALLGFGAWNVIDVVLFHWILRIHHIRLDTDQPIAWDIGWLVLLGLLPLLAGAWVLKGGRGAGRGGMAAPATLAGLVVAAGLWSLRPPPVEVDTAVVFAGSDPGKPFAAAAAIDARVVSVQGDGAVAFLRLAEPADRWRLYRYGALMIGGAGPGGCLTWTRKGQTT
jgi:uncharacterized membrane protein